jgi:anti-sigma regulatory factor (Ser/Thr protein kinase)
MRHTVRLDAVPASARSARDLVRRVCAGRSLGTRVLDTALLLTSELVVNAAVHGRGEVVLEVALEDHVLRASVTDAGPGEPEARRSDDLFDEGGRGLALVEDLATRWGVEPAQGGGKCVWFELAYVTGVG